MCSSLLSVIQHAKENSSAAVAPKLGAYDFGNKGRLGIIRPMQQSYMIRELEISWFYYNWKYDQGEILCFAKYLVRLDMFIGLLSDSVYSFGRLFMIHKNDKKAKKNKDTYERQKEELNSLISRFIIYLINFEFASKIEGNIEDSVNENLLKISEAIISKRMIAAADIKALNEYYVNEEPITSGNLGERIYAALSSLHTAMYNVLMSNKVGSNESERTEFKDYKCCGVDQGLERACVQIDQNKHFTSFNKKSPFPNIDDARVMQFISKYCVSTSSMTSFIKTQEAAVQLTDTSELSFLDIKKLSWDSNLMCSFNKVHSIVFKLLFLVIKKKWVSIFKNKEFPTSVTEKILHYLLPHMILSFISKFNGLFNENESLGPKLGYDRPIENSQALSILYSAFHLEDFCSIDGVMLGREQSVQFCLKNRPLSEELYKIFEDHDGLNALMRLTTLTVTTEGEYETLSAHAPHIIFTADGGTSQILYDVVLTFYNYLNRNDKRWKSKKSIPRKWMTRTELRDKSLRNETSDKTHSPPASGGRGGVKSSTTQSMERGTAQTTTKANSSVATETADIGSHSSPNLKHQKDNVWKITPPASGGRTGSRTIATRSMKRGRARTTREAISIDATERGDIDSHKLSDTGTVFHNAEHRNFVYDSEPSHRLISKTGNSLKYVPSSDTDESTSHVEESKVGSDGTNHDLLSGDEEESFSNSGKSEVDSDATNHASLSGDEDLVSIEESNEASDRFTTDTIGVHLRSLVKCLTPNLIADLDCPCGTGKNHTEFKLNDLDSFFKRIVSQEKLLNKDMMFLDIGSGKGMPQLLLWHLYKIPSHGIEISPFYTKVALQALAAYKKLKHEEDVKVSFSCIDLLEIKSLDPYRFIMCSLTGYVHSM